MDYEKMNDLARGVAVALEEIQKWQDKAFEDSEIRTFGVLDCIRMNLTDKMNQIASWTD